MKNKINRTGYMIGATALFVGLAGNVQAVPHTLQDYNTSQAVGSAGQSKLSSGSASFKNTSLSKLTKVKKGGKNVKNSSSNLTHPILGGLTPLTLTSPTAFPAGSLNSGTRDLPLVTIIPNSLSASAALAAQSAGPTNVPDGGATATMAGGALGGLLLLRKKLKS